MLKRVELSQLELGMFVHKLEGGWLDHPFWSSKFLLDDLAKLQALKSSKLSGVTIDTSKGKDVRPAKNESRPRVSKPAHKVSPRFKAIKKRATREHLAPAPTTMKQEIDTAQDIAQQATDKLHQTFLAARLGKALNVRTIQPVVRDIYESIRRNPQAFGGLMRCKLKNELMFHHALSVSALMVSLGRKMKLSASEVYQAGLAGLLLDIGVNHLPKTIEPPNGDFRKIDPKIWEQHVMLGYNALVSSDDLPQIVLDACLQHHERIDGSGFPDGLKGNQISLAGKMAAICDSFDFLLIKEGAAAALDPAEAIQRLRKMKGAFDPRVMRHFVELVGLYPIGSFVALSNGEIAMVIEEDEADHARPVVQAFYSLEQDEQIEPRRIALARMEDDLSITGTADLSDLDLPADDLLREMIFLSTFKNKT